MTRHPSLLCTLMAACALGSAPLLFAQGWSAQGGSAGGSVGRQADRPPAVSNPALVRISLAMSELRVDLVAERLVHDKDGDSGVVEQVFCEGAPGKQFSARLLEVHGAAQLTPEQLATKVRKYDLHASFLRQYQGFRISDPGLASENYYYLPIWSGTTLGRACRWAAVIPLDHDRSSWLLLLDDETGYPLYHGEYNAAGRLASEYRVTAFRPGVLAQIPSNVTWWKPTMFGLREFGTDLDAVQAFTVAPGTKLPLPAIAAELPKGYELAVSRISTLLLNGDQTLVFDYSDGIDHLLLSERQSPNPQQPASAGHQIMLFADFCATLCKFEHGGIEFLAVGGSGNVDSVSKLAKGLYARSVAR